MSMNMLTFLQMTGIFCAYLLVTLGLPAFVLERKLKPEHSLTERFLIYFMIGNFYVMNLVFILQLLKLSNFFTLIMGTLVPTAWAWVTLNRIPVKRIVKEWSVIMRRVSMGLMGRKTLTLRIWMVVKSYLGRFGRMIGRFLFGRTIDTMFVILLLGALIWIYGINIFEYYGYKESDLLVHNYWINAMEENDIFVAGVYPYGFHCMLYYLHAIFRFDNYVILRVFAFPQNIMIHLMLLSFLKLCCKSKYTAYLGTFLYTIGGFWAENTYVRYYSTLPQEYGMLFILPAVYFGFAYFKARSQELAEEACEPMAPKEKNWRKRWGNIRKSNSFLYLGMFAVSFAMTLSVHFYGTVIAGLYCIAMALGYGFLFFRKRYFREVAATCLVSVVIAVLPMLVAFLGGTPLQGSLGWGMNVIMGGNRQASVDADIQDNEQIGEPTDTTSNSDGTNGTSEKNSQTISSEEGTVSEGGAGIRETEEKQAEKKRLWERLQMLVQKGTDKFVSGWRVVYNLLNAFILRFVIRESTYAVMCAFPALIFLGVLFFLLKQKCYGAMLISTGIYMLLMTVLIASREIGLPTLMDINRGSIYFAYSLPIVISFVADAVLNLCFLPMKRKVMLNLVSALCVFAAVGGLWQMGRLKNPRDTQALIMNENIVCLTNIIKGERDDSWTIVSATDETQMGFDHGFHYETIIFLEDMENYDARTMIRIPTEKVYFFIEKNPVNYSITYPGSGQAVSEAGAAVKLPENSGIRMYQGDKRWTVMSRMYYWTQEFQRLYPNEMEVYLETDRFICYRIEQNPSRLYNFAIDYGYNTADYGED